MRSLEAQRDHLEALRAKREALAAQDFDRALIRYVCTLSALETEAKRKASR